MGRLLKAATRRAERWVAIGLKNIDGEYLEGKGTQFKFKNCMEMERT